jgi:hypothetical protein
MRTLFAFIGPVVHLGGMNLLRRNSTSPLVGYRHVPPLSIRWAGPDDTEQLEALAELDEAPIPPAPLMLGFVDDELWAAVSVSTGVTIADPFKPSGDVARLLAERGRQLTVTGRSAGSRLLRRGLAPARSSLRARLGASASGT